MSASAGSARLKVLFFSQRFPYPLDTGGKIRTGKLLEKLKDIFDITLISNMESPKDDEYLPQVQALCTEFHPVPWKETKKYTFQFYLRLLGKTFSPYPITVINDYSRRLEAKILNVLAKSKYDLLVCDFLQPSLNFRAVNGHRTLLFQHNVESVIVQRYFDTAIDPLSRLFWRSQWKKMMRYEQQACQRFSGIITVSEVDKEVLQKRFAAKNVFAIPTGVDAEYFSPQEGPVEANSLVFTGSMDWLPNEDAILFFAREILGEIKRHIPNVRLTVVGRNPSRRLLSALRRYPEIEVVGWVKDIRPFVSRHALYIIPLRIGGGTRIKAYEAMAMGKTMVSTRVGVEGLPVVDGRHLLLADEAHSFATAVVELLRNHEKRKQMEATARDFVRHNFSWAKVARVFADICRQVAHA
jgi:glycosyltransferase involved in cell wall biosynthesis